MKKPTIAIQKGRDPYHHHGNVNPPIYPTSTVLFPTLKGFFDADHGRHVYDDATGIRSKDLSYGITGTPTTFHLQSLVAELEGTEHALVFPSGLSAITTALFAFLKPGDHLLMVDSAYSPTRRLCEYHLKPFNIEVTYYDPLIGADIAALIQPSTKMIFMESPGSMTFEVQDVPAICRAAKSTNPDIITMIDNSWATPFFFEPVKHGVDVIAHAATKYMNGYSDILMGILCFNSPHFNTLFEAYHHFGIHTSPKDCYQTARGIRSMHTRIKQHEASALTLAKWLEKHPRVSKILHPAFPSCPGHEYFKRDYTGSTGLFSIILDKHYSQEQLSHMIDPLELFGIGCSWGGFESLILALDPRSSRSATQWHADGSLVRIYAGLEDVNDLIADLEAGLARLD